MSIKLNFFFILQLSDEQLKPVTGKAKVRFFYAGSLFAGVNITMKSDNNNELPRYLHPFSSSNYMKVHPDKYNVNIKVNQKNTKIPEKVSSRCSMAKLFLQISQYSQEKTCWSLFLIKLQAFMSATLWKIDSNTGVFLWTLRSFEEHLFWRISADGCFCKWQWYWQ